MALGQISLEEWRALADAGEVTWSIGTPGGRQETYADPAAAVDAWESPECPRGAYFMQWTGHTGRLAPGPEDEAWAQAWGAGTDGTPEQEQEAEAG